MSRWYPEIETQWQARKALNMGRFGALGAAVWMALPLLFLSRQMHPVEMALVVALVAVMLLAAWRFRNGQGGISGAIALVIMLIEVAKRIWMTIEGQLGFGILEGVLVFMIAAGLFNGVRAARALRDLPPDTDDVADVFA